MSAIAVAVVVIVGRLMFLVRDRRLTPIVMVVDIHGDDSASVRQVMRRPSGRWGSQYKAGCSEAKHELATGENPMHRELISLPARLGNVRIATPNERERMSQPRSDSSCGDL